jgi:fibronectin type 3 domain-containing protein
LSWFLLLGLALVASFQQSSSITLTLKVNHTVVLTWTASTGTDVAGYNIYRGTKSGGPYVKIGTDNALDFTDAVVTSGSTYFYVVTAFDSSGNESANSNEASAVIPNP